MKFFLVVTVLLVFISLSSASVLEGEDSTLEALFLDNGFIFSKGKMGFLTKGMCTQCLGSAAKVSNNPYAALLFSNDEQIEPPPTLTCEYYNTKDNFCFSVNATQAIVATVEGPVAGLFDEFSWGVYIYDISKSGENERVLIQAPIDFPIRPTHGNRMVLVFGLQPNLVDVLADIILDAGYEENDIHIFPMQSSLSVDDLISLSPRITIVVKYIPQQVEPVMAFMGFLIESANIYKVSMVDSQDVGILHPLKYGVIMDDMKKPTRFVKTDAISEKTMLSDMVTLKINEIYKKYRVVHVSYTVSLRDFTGVQNANDSIKKRINCLGEDWDVSYSVSGGFYLPDPPQYMFAVVGVDHADGRRTTLSLMDAVKNQEVLSITDVESDSNFVYVQWFARNCSLAEKPCVEITKQDVSSAVPVFLRERVFGVSSHSSFIMPTIFWINKYDSSINE